MRVHTKKMIYSHKDIFFIKFWLTSHHSFEVNALGIASYAAQAIRQMFACFVFTRDVSKSSSCAVTLRYVFYFPVLYHKCLERSSGIGRCNCTICHHFAAVLSLKFPEERRSGTRLRAADIMVFGRRPAIVCNCPVGLTCKTCPEDIVLEMVGVSDGLYFSQYSTGDVGEVFKMIFIRNFHFITHHISTGSVLFLLLHFHSRLMLRLSNTVLTHGAFQQLGLVPVSLLRTYSSHQHPKWLKYFSIHSAGRKYHHTLWSRLSVIWTLRRVNHKTLKVSGYGFVL